MSENGPPPRAASLTPAGHPAPESRRKATDLRVAVRALVSAALGQVPARDVEAAAAEVCTRAREEGLPVERVLIIMRSEWETADKSGALRSATGEALRARLVSHCIRRFYERQS